MKAGPRESRAYQRLHAKYRPQTPLLRNVTVAFLVGGTICAFGQLVYDFYLGLGFTPAEAAGPLAGTMIFLGAFLTGLGVYDWIGDFGGMGAALPITGFANAIVAPAMESKREGLVQGLGTKMFEVAGPVLVYGLTVSFVVGAVRYIIRAY